MIAAPSLFERIPRPDHPRDLNPDFLMSYSTQGRAETWDFSNAGSNVSIQAGGKIISNNGDFLYALAVAGEGICVLPDFITDKGLASGQVVQVMPSWSITSLWLTLYYPPYEQLPPIVGTFADYFEKFVQDHPNLETQV
jgi:DNA-binding transcriptional LysR family regulator